MRAFARFELQASLATLRDPFEACRVRVDREPLAAGSWDYAKKTGVLTARFRGRSPVLTATGKGC